MYTYEYMCAYPADPSGYVFVSLRRASLPFYRVSRVPGRRALILELQARLTA